MLADQLLKRDSVQSFKQTSKKKKMFHFLPKLILRANHFKTKIEKSLFRNSISKRTYRDAKVLEIVPSNFHIKIIVAQETFSFENSQSLYYRTLRFGEGSSLQGAVKLLQDGVSKFLFIFQNFVNNNSKEYS